MTTSRLKASSVPVHHPPKHGSPLINYPDIHVPSSANLVTILLRLTEFLRHIIGSAQAKPFVLWCPGGKGKYTILNKNLHTSTVDSEVYFGNCINSTLAKALFIKLLEWGGKDRVSLWQRSAEITSPWCVKVSSWPSLERSY